MRKSKMKKLWFLALAVAVAAATLAACGQQGTDDAPPPPTSSSLSSSLPSSSSASETVAPSEDASSVDEAVSSSQNTSATQLYVQFGDEGDPFTMHLYDNETSAAIARHVGTADWRIPLYNYEGYDSWEVMQYYDIPSRYEIPSNAEKVTEEMAGAVYYSEPNRIVLFYGEAEVSGEYTPVGYFEATQEFISAVQDNPVLEGWGNKIILISTTR